jgi:hypothetical protein
MATVLMLIGCEGKLEPKDVFEVKIDGNIKKINDDEASKFSKYRNSICKVSEYFKTTSNKQTLATSESTVFTDGKNPPQEEIIKYSSNSVFEFDIKDYKINMEKILLGQDREIITIKDLTALDDMFLVLEKMKKNWTKVDVYSSDTSSFENLKNFKEYWYFNMHLERNTVVCEKQHSTKK